MQKACSRVKDTCMNCYTNKKEREYLLFFITLNNNWATIALDDLNFESMHQNQLVVAQHEWSNTEALQLRQSDCRKAPVMLRHSLRHLPRPQYTVLYLTAEVLADGRKLPWLKCVPWCWRCSVVKIYEKNVSLNESQISVCHRTCGNIGTGARIVNKG